MERVPVSSTNVAAIGYDEDTEILEIEFTNGAVYQYFGVPSGEFNGFMGSDSKGKFFNANIKNRYSVSKL